MGDSSVDLSQRGEGSRRLNRPPRVLVVEDEVQPREFLAAELTRAAFTVSAASNGQEGLEQVYRFQPDVIVLDLILPEIIGCPLARRWRKPEYGSPTRLFPGVALRSHAL